MKVIVLVVVAVIGWLCMKGLDYQYPLEIKADLWEHPYAAYNDAYGPALARFMGEQERQPANENPFVPQPLMVPKTLEKKN